MEDINNWLEVRKDGDVFLIYRTFYIKDSLTIFNRSGYRKRLEHLSQESNLYNIL